MPDTEVVEILQKYHLDQTLDSLQGPSPEQIKVCNQWAAVALDKFHQDCTAKISFLIDSIGKDAILQWDSTFSKAAMKEKTEMANHGGVALAFFVMSVISDFGYVEQSEIGDGVDYHFKKEEPKDDDLNFLDDSHYVEISGILEESSSNTLKSRLRTKHSQIARGFKKNEFSSVIVTLFSQPKTVKEVHYGG